MLRRWQCGVILIIIFVAMVFGLLASAGGAKTSEPGWIVVRSRYFEIYYQDYADLVRLTYRVAKSKDKETARLIKAGGVIGAEELRVYDELFEETMKLLGLRSGGRLAIRIYPDYASLSGEYERLAGRRDAVVAFYNPRQQVICLNASADRSVVGHEMAHALVDMAFLSNPPAEVQELLAGYVQSRI